MVCCPCRGALAADAAAEDRVVEDPAECSVVEEGREARRDDSPLEEVVTVAAARAVGKALAVLAAEWEAVRAVRAERVGVVACPAVV